MKIRLMGTREQNEKFIELLKKLPEVVIVSESLPYANRNSTTLERVYLEIELRKSEKEETAEMIDALLDFQGIYQYQ